MTDIVRSAAVQSLLDRASGLGESGGNPRLKSITRDLLQALMTIIEKHDISESEFWQAVKSRVRDRHSAADAGGA